MISPHAIVETHDVGDDVDIAEFAVVRSGASLGRGVRIHPHAVIEPGVRLEDEVEVFPGAYLGKEPKGARATARAMSFERRLVIGRGTSIGPNAVIFYDVEIGAGTLIGDGASIREQCRVGARCIISRYVTVNYNTTIGDGTRIMDLTHITGNCVIGDDVFISVLVSTANDNEMVTRRYEEGRVVGPRIGSRVSVGEGACILPGVTIGDGALIGAGSVVTKDVAPHALVIGVPARFVRKLEGGGD
jgi:acetyltransferase-like isoleucine patch superfamily enzyme